MIPKRNMVPNNHAGAQVDIFTRVQVQFPGYLKFSSDRPLRTTFFIYVLRISAGTIYGYKMKALTVA